MQDAAFFQVENLFDTNKTSLRIKCTIPAKEQKFASVMRDIFEDTIKGQLGRMYNVKTFSEPLLIKDTYEFVVEVEPFTHRLALFTLMRFFFRNVRACCDELKARSKLKCIRDKMPVVFVSSSLFFSDLCTPAHSNVPIESVHFGNIINSGALAVHWTIEFWKVAGKNEFELHRKERMEDKISVNFEHDRGAVFIRFIADEKSQKNQWINKNVEYTIKFFLSAIRRIIIDPISMDGPTGPESQEKFRIHFELNCPPQLYTFVQGKSFNAARTGDGSRVKFLRQGMGAEWQEKIQFAKADTFCDSTVVSMEFNQSTMMERLFDIISRLRVRANVPIEFASMDLINMHIGRKTPYVKDPLGGEAYFERIRDAAPDCEPLRKKSGEAVPKCNNVSPEQFALRYIIEAMLSRGAKVKDQLLVNVEIWARFLDIVCGQYKRDAQKTLLVMESVINRIDETSFPPVSIFRLMREEFVKYEETKKLNDAQIGLDARQADMDREGYVKVRKIVITPTRVVYIAPEQIMGNRILRKHYKTGTEILRVTFRDDDTQPMRTVTTGEKLTEKTVSIPLTNGIVVGGRNFRYLGSSNSQMRDNGCYFVYDRKQVKMDANDVVKASEIVNRIRRQMGRLDELTNVAKFMARMGQCFTQSRAVNTGLPLHTSNFAFDITGGNSAEFEGDELEMYTYSDGVGQMSLEYIKKIAKDLKLPNHPCVIQFRHRGYKGVLSLHPPLDDINNLRKKLELVLEDEKQEDDQTVVYYKSNGKDENGDHFKLLNCRFRYSQMKFHAPEEEDFEVVKISGPTPVCLNKPFINILDQVSEMQSRDSHVRLCDRVEELLHRQLRMMAETLVREKACRDKLKELPRRVSIDGLSRQHGFALTTEPYFRSVLRAAVRFMLKKQLNKEQIQIPLDLGRSMFGVVDETGLLQYGQIFVQYHVNASDKTPKPSASKIIRKGPTLITKNPCISAGDVRMFEAVDIPSLRHLVDVVVFPQHGPRPHPDEMAGSDLDGDEYSVIWDPKLFFDYNETPMKFPKGKSQSAKLNMDTLDRDVREFFIKYITQDSVGMIANAHLNNSDLWGLNSKVAQGVAYKHSQAVDFPKTAVPPAALTKKWEKNEITGEMDPPERSHRKPDFMQSNRDPVYASSRLIGRIYREIGHVDNVLALSEERDQQEEVSIDDMIFEEGWEAFQEEAYQQMIIYNNEMKALMERYGVASEGELMSGCMISIRNAISDREADDMSFFNTNQVIETQITHIVRTHRENFFKKFGDIKKLTMVASDRGKHVQEDTDNIFDREVSSPSVEMRQKAVAMYRVAYEYASRQNDSSARLLSYPWIAYDVLAVVRAENNRKLTNFIAGLDPVDEMLTAQVRENAAANQQKFFKKIGEWTGEDGRGYGYEALLRYLNYYDGLAELAFFFVEWAENEKISMRHFRDVHIVVLLIQFCLGMYDELEAVITSIPHGTRPLEPRVAITNLGKIVLNFLRWLSSRSFKRIKCVTFDKPDLGVEGCFMRGEWMPMHLAAVKSFYDLIFSLRIDLPLGEGEIRVDPVPIIREMNPFVVELPILPIPEEKVAEMIRLQTGAQQVQLRRLETAEKTRVVVSATGTLLSHSKIRDLLVVPLNIKTAQNPEEMSELFPYFIFAKIQEGAAVHNLMKIRS